MLTPVFKVTQTDEFVIVTIEAPHVRSPDVDFYVAGNLFKFTVHPYFLRLCFPGHLVEDEERSKCVHDISTGTFEVRSLARTPSLAVSALTRCAAHTPHQQPTRPAVAITPQPAARAAHGPRTPQRSAAAPAQRRSLPATAAPSSPAHSRARIHGAAWLAPQVHVPKADPGEVFEGLDLLTVLLSRKHAAVKAPLIEVIGGAAAGDAQASVLGVADDDVDWEEFFEEEQVLPAPELGPELAGAGIALTNKVHYGFDGKYEGLLGKMLREIPDCIEIVDPEGTAVGDRDAARVAAEEARFKAEHYAHYAADFEDPTYIRMHQAFAPLWAEWAAPGPAPGPVVFSAKDQDDLRDLPRKEYIVSDTKGLLIGLIDVVFAWAYDHRTTEGEHTVESAWTITSLASSLSFLVQHRTVWRCVVAGARRCLCYPLYRHWDLVQQTLEDTKAIFRMGRRAVLRCLLDVRRVLKFSEAKYLLNDIFITDYCVWIQSVPDMHIEALARKLETITLEKEDIGLPLLAVEEIVSAEADEGGADGELDSDDQTDSDGSEEVRPPHVMNGGM